MAMFTAKGSNHHKRNKKHCRTGGADPQENLQLYFLLFSGPQMSLGKMEVSNDIEFLNCHINVVEFLIAVVRKKWKKKKNSQQLVYSKNSQGYYYLI